MLGARRDAEARTNSRFGERKNRIDIKKPSVAPAWLPGKFNWFELEVSAQRPDRCSNLLRRAVRVGDRSAADGPGDL